MTEKTVGCPICDSTDYPHTHHLATIINSRYYCPDGHGHVWAPRKWRFSRYRCIRCDERSRTGELDLERLP